MPKDNRGLYTPDFYPDMQPQGWVDMGEDPQVNISPAVGAFKQRFMQKPQQQAPSMSMPDHELPEMPDVTNATGKMKSL